MLSGYNAFIIFLRLRKHFEESSFDYFKSPLKYTYTNYEKARFKNLFEFVARKYPEKNRCFLFYLGNFIQNKSFNMSLLKDHFEECRTDYLKWKARYNSMLYYVEKDLNKLLDKQSFESLISSNSRWSGKIDYPDLLVSYLQREIYPETILCLDSLYNIISQWKEIREGLVLPSVIRHLEAYKPFVRVDEPLKQMIYTKVDMNDVTKC